MKIQYHPVFLEKLKKSNVRIRNKFLKQLAIFIKNPDDPILRNHSLREEWEGYKSIVIIADWRALYEEIISDDETIAYFSYIGTHKELYGW